MILVFNGDMKGDNVMFIFDNNEFEKYEKEASIRWKNSQVYQEHIEKTKNYSKDKWNSLAREMDEIFASFAVCMKNGNDIGSMEVQNIVAKLQNHITDNYYVCTNDILLGLGLMYVSDERFKNNINKHGFKTAEFVNEAIEFYCNK